MLWKSPGARRSKRRRDQVDPVPRRGLSQARVVGPGTGSASGSAGHPPPGRSRGCGRAPGGRRAWAPLAAARPTRASVRSRLSSGSSPAQVWTSPILNVPRAPPMRCSLRGGLRPPCRRTLVPRGGGMARTAVCGAEARGDRGGGPGARRLPPLPLGGRGQRTRPGSTRGAPRGRRSGRRGGAPPGPRGGSGRRPRRRGPGRRTRPATARTRRGTGARGGRQAAKAVPGRAERARGVVEGGEGHPGEEHQDPEGQAGGDRPPANAGGDLVEDVLPAVFGLEQEPPDRRHRDQACEEEGERASPPPGSHPPAERPGDRFTRQGSPLRRAPRSP